MLICGLQISLQISAGCLFVYAIGDKSHSSELYIHYYFELKNIDNDDLYGKDSDLVIVCPGVLINKSTVVWVWSSELWPPGAVRYCFILPTVGKLGKLWDQRLYVLSEAWQCLDRGNNRSYSVSTVVVWMPSRHLNYDHCYIKSSVESLFSTVETVFAVSRSAWRRTEALAG